MNVTELLNATNWQTVNAGEPKREVTGCYCGDLLSWVMARSGAGDCWLTIMSNVNVAAVAQLNELSAVVLCEGVQPDEALLGAARSRGINLFRCEVSVFEAACLLGELLK